jgi:lipoyl(octanoyl) transferase
MRVRDLGRVDYLDAWAAMREFTRTRAADTPDELWLLEHPPVYTLGQAGRPEHLHAPGAIPVVATDRGGQVTYHGPGQVVVYTLVDLRRAGYFVRELVYRIEESVIQTLDSLGVAGRRVRGAPGVYVSPDPVRRGLPAPAPDAAGPQFDGMAKIAALGIKVHRGCAYHGVALNVAMDLAPFSAIDPCGYRGLAATDLATLGAPSDRRACAQRLIERLQAHLAPVRAPEQEEP